MSFHQRGIVVIFLHLIYNHYETLTWVKFLVGWRVQREKVTDIWSNREK